MAFKSSIRQRKYDYLIKQGFRHMEAVEFSRTSRSGMKAPYFQHMLRSRKRTVENLKRAGRTDKQIRDYIKKQYVDNNWLKADKLGRVRIDPWKLLREHEDKAHRRGEEYESPWRKRAYKRKSTKKEKKRITRKDMLNSLIEKLQNRIKRTASDRKRLALEDQLFDYQQQLRRMG